MAVNSQIFKFHNNSVVNIFTEISHADKCTIDRKHIKQYFSSNACVDLGGGTEAKIQLIQNMVMLHIW